MARATILRGSAISPGNITIPDGTQIITIHGYINGTEESPAYVRLDGVGMELAAHSGFAGETYDGKCSASAYYMVEPPKGTVVFSTDVDWVWVAYCISGINPVDPIADADADTYSSADRYQTCSCVVSGDGPATLCVGQYYWGEGASDVTTDDYETLGSNRGVYADCPADGTFTLTSYKADSGSWGTTMISLISLNLPPAIRRAGIILD